MGANDIYDKVNSCCSLYERTQEILFCPDNLLCFARFTQQIAVISLYNIQLLVSVIEKEYV